MKYLVVFLSLFFLSGCNKNNNFEENLKRLDEVHGKCDNPFRKYGAIEYKICKDKERAAGPDGEVGDPVDITNLFSKIGQGGGTVIASDTNNHLWDASIQLVSPYSLNISDFEGGYIETNWILNQATPNNRCLIKIHITSVELVSNGVNTKIVCEDKIGESWYRSETSYQVEEKDLTLKILTEAARLSSSS